MSHDKLVGRYIAAIQEHLVPPVDLLPQMIRDFEKELDAYVKTQTPKPTLGQNGITIGQSAFCHVCRTDPCPPRHVFAGINCYGGAWHAFSAGEAIDRAIDRMGRNTLVVQEIEEGPTPGTSKTTFHYPRNDWATLRIQTNK
jgi:hypothetical protein